MTAATRAQKLLSAPELSALARYHLRNRTELYNVYTEPGRTRASFVAPEYVLIRNHERYGIRRLRIQEIQARENVVAVCEIEDQPVDLLAENLSDLLGRGENEVAISAEGNLLHRYTRPAGLFNYYEEHGEFVLHYHPEFGRGEHAEFFNFWQCNLYGVFMPDSFIGIKPITREGSRLIYRELCDSGVLNHRGHLRGEALLEAHEFRNEEARANEAGLRNFLRERPRRRNAEAEFTALIRDVPPEIRQELNQLQLCDPVDAAPEEYFTNLAPDRLRILSQLYVERIAAAEVARQIVKNRGIVKKSETGDVLLLLSDDVQSSSPFYGRLYSFGQGLAEGRRTRIAYAYRAPVPRNAPRAHHPLVEAARDFEKLKAVDGLDESL